jgi:hypothetical protein
VLKKASTDGVGLFAAWYAPDSTYYVYTYTTLYPAALKKATECPTSLLYLDILLQFDNGKYTTLVFHKQDSFALSIVNFWHPSSNIPAKPAYGVYSPSLYIHIVQFKDKLTQKNKGFGTPQYARRLKGFQEDSK